MTFSDAARDIADAIALGIAVLFVVRIAAKGKTFRGMIAGRTSLARVAPERVQLLLVTLLLAGWYLFQVLAARGSSIPPVSNLVVCFFGFSCTVYVVGDAVRTF
jgi:hypothetical protein